MGTSVVAECRCGYHASGSVGGGMFDFEDVCWFPCLCEGCHAMVDVNLFETPLRCPTCRSERVAAYDDAGLSLPPESQELYSIADWNVAPRIGRPLQLTNGRYRCPKCGQMSLQFRMDGLWD